MRRPDRLTRHELETQEHYDLNDGIVLDIASRIFQVSVKQIIVAAMLYCKGSAHPTFVRQVYSEYLVTERVPQYIRKYAVNALLGRCIMITDEIGKDCYLIA